VEEDGSAACSDGVAEDVKNRGLDGVSVSRAALLSGFRIHFLPSGAIMSIAFTVTAVMSSLR